MRTVVSCFALLIVATIALADPVENPEYTSWSKHKAGTSVTTKTSSKIKDISSEVKTTTKLVEVGKDKLVLETETATVVNGMEFKAPGMKRDVQKSIDVPKPKAGEKAPAPGKPEGTTEEGAETLKIGGTEVKTKWYKYKSKTPTGEVSGQTWMSEDVPGQLVKMEVTAGDVKTTTEVIEFKKP
jgi:hypothetical protein